MITRKHMSRRSALKVLGASGTIAFGTGTATASEREEAVPTFFARLSDNPSIQGHGKVYSRGRGRLDLVGDTENGETVLHFELTVANLEQGAFAAHIHGEGRADGDIWAGLYEGDPINNETISGTIRNEDVADDVGGVSELIWDELVEGNGVVNVHTGFEPGGEIAGIVRPRPVGGWIAV